MAYCHKTSPGSDLYLWKGAGAWHCTNCNLQPEAYEESLLHSLPDVLMHLLWHQTVGDRVPKAAMDRVARELSRYFVIPPTPHFEDVCDLWQLAVTAGRRPFREVFDTDDYDVVASGDEKTVMRAAWKAYLPRVYVLGRGTLSTAPPSGKAS